MKCISLVCMLCLLHLASAVCECGNGNIICLYRRCTRIVIAIVDYSTAMSWLIIIPSLQVNNPLFPYIISRQRSKLFERKPLVIAMFYIKVIFNKQNHILFTAGYVCICFEVRCM